MSRPLLPPLHNIRDGIRVIPIILRPVYWQIEPLKKLQVLPKDAKPITSWNNRDEAFLDIVNGLLKVVRQLLLPFEAEKQIHISNLANVKQEAANILKELQNTQGEVLGDQYRLHDLIGRGDMATVYRGQNIRTKSIVAIKVLRQVVSADTYFVFRFLRVAKAVSALQHPNIVQVFDYGQTDDNYYIVMELVEGTDLRHYLRSRGVLDIDRAIIIAHDVALGLAAAHRSSIVHLDVKPQNVLVSRSGKIKLSDFGAANIYQGIETERRTTNNMMYNTIRYFAPEQAKGETFGPTADVYALGIVMYEMLTGYTPFDGDSAVLIAMKLIKDLPIPPRQYNPTIPMMLEEIILRCLEKKPEMRFSNGGELARALESLGDEDLQT